MTIETKPEIKPVIQKARKIPVTLRNKLKVEFEKLEKNDIIVKEVMHIEWVSNILIVEKEKPFRFCLDPIPLN